MLETKNELVATSTYTAAVALASLPKVLLSCLDPEHECVRVSNQISINPTNLWRILVQAPGYLRLVALVTVGAGCPTASINLNLMALVGALREL